MQKIKLFFFLLFIYFEKSYGIKNSKSATNFRNSICTIVFHEEYACVCYLIHSQYVLAATTCTMNQFYVDINYLFVNYNRTKLNRREISKLYPVEYVIGPEGYRPGASQIDRASFEMAIVRTQQKIISETVTRTFNWNQLPWEAAVTFYSYGYRDEGDTDYPQQLQYGIGSLKVHACNLGGNPFASYMILCFQTQSNQKMYRMKGDLGALVFAGPSGEGEEKATKLIGIYTGAQYQPPGHNEVYDIIVNVAYYADWVEAIVNGNWQQPHILNKFATYPVSSVKPTVPEYECRSIDLHFQHVYTPEQKPPEDNPICKSEKNPC